MLPKIYRTLLPDMRTLRNNITDTDGNRLMVEYGTGKITLHLRKLNRDFHIGMFARIGGKVCYYKEESEADIFHKNDSWSINYEVLKLVEGTINYKTTSGIYRISIEDAHKLGSFLWFQSAGIERKWYVPRKFWEFTKIVE